MRDVDLALIVCGNRICEVITATLGPLPLDQLPKSKPVTPYAVLIDDTARRGTSNLPVTGVISPRVAQHTRNPQHSADMRNPCGRWRWPKTRPQGLTGRVGAGPNGAGPPPR